MIVTLNQLNLGFHFQRLSCTFLTFFRSPGIQKKKPPRQPEKEKSAVAVSKITTAAFFMQYPHSAPVLS